MFRADTKDSRNRSWTIDWRACAEWSVPWDWRLGHYKSGTTNWTLKHHNKQLHDTVTRETLLDIIIPGMRSWFMKGRRNLHKSEYPTRMISECLDKMEDLLEDALTLRWETCLEQGERPFRIKDCTVAKVKIKGINWKPIFNSKHVGSASPWRLGSYNVDGSFLIQTEDAIRGKVLRYMRWTEIARALGHSEEKIEIMWRNHWPLENVLTEMKYQSRKEKWSETFLSRHLHDGLASLWSVARKREKVTHYNNEQGTELLDISTTYQRTTPIFQTGIDIWTTIPLPTQTMGNREGKWERLEKGHQ